MGMNMGMGMGGGMGGGMGRMKYDREVSLCSKRAAILASGLLFSRVMIRLVVKGVNGV